MPPETRFESPDFFAEPEKKRERDEKRNQEDSGEFQKKSDAQSDAG